MKIRILALAAMLAVPLSPSFALEVPKGGVRDSRIRTVAYSPMEVFKIVGRFKSSIQIQFGENEEIIDVANGNTVSWETAPSGSSLFLKAREKGPVGNMTVVTVLPSGARRSYQFELEIVDGSVQDKNAFFAIRFSYPEDEAALRKQNAQATQAEREAEVADAALALHQRYGPKNWRYSAQGARDIQPDSIYDDGKVTTMRFAGNRQVPSIYAVQSDGTKTLVAKDSRDSGQTVVVHTLAREFRLRRGDDIVCLFNEAFDPVGVNTGTGTTSPSVQRDVRKGRGQVR